MHEERSGHKFGASRVAVLLAAVAMLAPSAVAQRPVEPDSVLRAGFGDAGLWQLRSRHLLWGMPRQTDNRHNVVHPGEAAPRPGLSVLVREGFVVGHHDRLKIPAWVAVHWTLQDYERMSARAPARTAAGNPGRTAAGTIGRTSSGKHEREFTEDRELPPYARAGTDYDHETSGMDRGHMARCQDNEAWGEDCFAAGCRMSNIVPQRTEMNGKAWNDLEELHQEVVRNPVLGISEVWVISGPIIEDTDGDGVEDPVGTVGNEVAIPHATYKVIGWFDSYGRFHARGYVVRQEDRVRDPAHYLSAIDDIEAATGLDFFPDLPEPRATEIESLRHRTPWGSEEGLGAAPPVGQILIASLLPNPVRDEAQNEAVTIRNTGADPVSLQGWRLRDAARQVWYLSGVVDGGTEITVLSAGQPMALNNRGDSVELLDPAGVVVDRGSYESAPEGERVELTRLQ